MVTTSGALLTAAAPASVPAVLAAYGVGMGIGNAVGGRAADSSVTRSIAVALAALAVLQSLFSVFAPQPFAAVTLFFLIALTASALVPAQAQSVEFGQHHPEGVRVTAARERHRDPLPGAVHPH